MAYTPYTQKRNHQFRGLSSTEDYNLRNEENYKDLAVLYNTQSDTEALLEESASYYQKQLESISAYLEDVENRIAALEDSATHIAFVSEDQIDTDIFDSTPFEIDEDVRCSFWNKYNLLTLPYVASSSLSKIKFQNEDGTFSTSSNLEMLVVPITSDETGAVVETSQPVYAVVNEVGRIWQRNVIVESTSINGAQMYLYVRIPNDLSITQYTNAILLDLFPIYGVTLMSVEYSTDPQINLNGTATWTPLNDTATYYNIDEAVGYLPPGAWDDDTINKAGPLAFFFKQKAITALRFGLKRTEAYVDGAQSVYSYGMSNLDVRYNKFADEGVAIIRFDAPTGSTISSIDSVTPHLWNVPEYLVDECFSYEVIWETSFESGTYTTSPVPLSQRVWLKVTLSKSTTGDQLPSLSNLIVSFS